MTSLSDKAGFLIVANLIKYAVGFIMPMVLVRMLDRHDYGTYQQLNLIGTMGIAILVLGLPNSVYFFYDRTDAAKDKVLTLQTTGVLAAMGALAALALFAFTPAIVSLMQNESLRPLLAWWGLSLGLLIASEHFVQVMIARDRYTVAVATETAETAVRVAILVVPLLLGWGLLGLVVAQVGYAVIRFTVRSVWLLQPLGSLRRPPGQPWFTAEQLAYSLPIGGMYLVSLVGGFFDRGIVATRFTPADYAIYSVGSLEIPLDAIFQSSVATVLRASMPALIRDGNHAEVQRLMREGVRKLSLIVLPCFVFFAGYAYDFVTVLFTSQYERSVPVFLIYLLNMPLNMFILSPLPPAYGRTRLNFHLVTVSSCVHAVLSLTLLHWIGFYGPAISAVFTSWMLSGMYFYWACRLTGGTVATLLPLGHFARVLGVCALAVGACKVVLGAHSHSVPGLALAGALFALLSLGGCAAAGVFTSTDRALARRWLARVGIASRRTAG